MDRVRATRFGIRSIQHLESMFQIYPNKDELADDPMSAAVIGIRGAQVVISPMELIERRETDWAFRRPKNEFWRHFKGLVETLSGRSTAEEPLTEVKPPSSQQGTPSLS